MRRCRSLAPPARAAQAPYTWQVRGMRLPTASVRAAYDSAASRHIKARPLRRPLKTVHVSRTAYARALRSPTESARLVVETPAAARQRSISVPFMGPELAGAAEVAAEHELTQSGLVQELLSRAAKQGAAALSAGRASDALKFFTEAAELARATPGATPAVVSGVLARRSEAHLAAGDPERALHDSLTAVQLSATSEVRAPRSVSSTHAPAC